MGGLRRRYVQPGLVAGLALAPWGLAMAAPSPSPTKAAKAEEERVRARYRFAQEAIVAERWEEARAALDEVAASKEAAVVFYYRGLCHAHLGAWIEALDDFARAVRLAGERTDADSKYVFTESMKGLAEAKRHVADVALVVRPVAAGDEPVVTLDGAPLSSRSTPTHHRDQTSWGPFRLIKGEHTFEVRMGGRLPLQRTFQLPEGESEGELRVVKLEWPVPPARPAARPVTPALTHPEAAQSAGAAPWVLGGVAVGLGVASTALFALHFAEGRNAAGETPHLVPAALFGGGAVVTGALGWVLAGSSPSTRASGAAPPRLGTASLQPPSLYVVGMPGGAGVTWAGSLW